ncbi:type I restriction modification DNA specificity domain protein [Streptococcus sp. M143]|uniref:restriction endonuclease subunit S n=1 Tax=Streptococcus sp. M143 TaxID=563037 RepID=UPI0001BEE6A5|nr:restriction endonuclease subunit S [Streptococcus sp. M143]EFA24459.1 type I restriction modification DNA specificity domain protein [Streptococcus sp. M143]
MKKVKLGEVCEILNGFAFKSLLYVNEGIRIIRITNVQKGYIEDSDPKYYPIEYTNSIEKYILKENDLLMSLTGNVGRVGLISKTMLPAALNQRVACLRTIDSLISKEYVFQFLNSDLFEQSAIRSSNGVAQKNLSTDWLKKVEITYPSVEQQELITSTLNLIERLICCRKEQNKKLNELVKSRFNEMFGDPVFNEMRWRRCKLKDISIEKLAYGSGASAIDFSGLRYIRITDIDECGNLKLDKKSPSHYDEKYLLNTGDILFARSGATVGKTFLYSKEKYGPALYAGYLIRLIPNLSLVNPVFVYHFTNTKFYNDFIAKVQNTVAQPNINAKQYSELDFILPPLSLQNEFADFVAQVDKSQLAIQKSLEELETLKKSLMQEYFG